MLGQTWKVVGGADKGGILVREGKDIKSAQLPDRLATDSIVKGLTLEGDRLQYERVTGTGPSTGWVSIKLKDKQLLEPVEDAVPVSVSPDAPWKPPPVSGRKPRVVCLHGTACGEKIFKMQLNKLLPKAKEVEWIFVEGAISINVGPAFETMQKFFPGCPNTTYDNVSLDENGWRIYGDPKATLDYLQSQLRAHAPVDGLLGFSQGANFAVMLAAQASLGAGIPIGFAVLLCPNAPGYVAQLPDIFKGEPLPVPMLICRGEKEGYGAGMEPVFDKAQADGLFKLDTKGEDAPAAHVAKLCENVEMLSHPEGHAPLPRDKQKTEEIVGRIKSFISEKTQ